MGRGFSANKLERGFQNGSCQHWGPHGRMSSQNGCRQCLCPWGELQLPPASLGGSPGSVGGSDPGSFQITASSLCLGGCEILCAPFKSGDSISYSPLALPKVSPVGLQSEKFQGLILPVQEPWTGEHNVGPGPLAPWREPLQL